MFAPETEQSRNLALKSLLHLLLLGGRKKAVVSIQLTGGGAEGGISKQVQGWAKEWSLGWVNPASS